jgi:hypothetical protein
MATDNSREMTAQVITKRPNQRRDGAMQWIFVLAEVATGITQSFTTWDQSPQWQPVAEGETWILHIREKPSDTGGVHRNALKPVTRVESAQAPSTASDGNGVVHPEIAYNAAIDRREALRLAVEHTGDTFESLDLITGTSVELVLSTAELFYKFLQQT